jgi:hypothetical protein
MSIRDDIRARGHSLKFKVVDVPDWDRKLVVQELTVRDRNTYVQSGFERVEVAGSYDMVPVADPMREVRLVIATTCEAVTDEQGQTVAGDKVFTDEDIEWLGDDSPTAVDVLFNAAAELSGLGDSAQEAITEAGKDSEATPETSSSSS